MSYLYPPPSPNLPVVVQKDFGGLVSEYRAMTELYRQQNREVRLHECRSACTLALSLPNVCVYPKSVLRFHSAYHRDTKQVDQSVSRELLNAYPAAIRERLGNRLTRGYRSLSGAELIQLGVRDCTQPAGGTMIARARQAPARTVVASNAPAQNDAGLATVVDGVRAFLGFDGPQQSSATMAPQPPIMTAALQPADLSAVDPPLPPARPREIGGGPGTDEGAGEVTAGPNMQMAMVDAPVPPRRRDHVRAADEPPALALPRMIVGAQPILPTTFTAYARLR